MIFSPSDFEKFLAKGQAILVAKVANSLIDSKGAVVFGSRSAEGDLVDFSSDQKKSDSHVGILVSAAEMGSLDPHPDGFRLDQPSDREVAQALEAKIAYLEKEKC